MKKLFSLVVMVALVLLGSVTAYSQGVLTPLEGIQIRSQTLNGLNRPSYTDTIVLEAATAVQYTLPTGSNYALFSATQNFYVAYSGVATIPSTNIVNGTGAELNPVLRTINGLATISLICEAACIVTISTYK